MGQWRYSSKGGLFRVYRHCPHICDSIRCTKCMVNKKLSQPTLPKHIVVHMCICLNRTKRLLPGTFYVTPPEENNRWPFEFSSVRLCMFALSIPPTLIPTPPLPTPRPFPPTPHSPLPSHHSTLHRPRTSTPSNTPHLFSSAHVVINCTHGKLDVPACCYGVPVSFYLMVRGLISVSASNPAGACANNWRFVRRFK